MNIKNKGFTLIEVLATVIILSIVLLIAIPSVLKAIEKTKKNAFAADAIIAGSEAVKKLNTDYLNGIDNMPLEGKSVVVTISDLNNEDLNKYGGQVTVKRENDILKPYVTITDDNYYICNTEAEYIKTSTITKSNDCSIEPEPEVIVREINKPILAQGMVPIKWDESGNVVDTDESDSAWYDYSKEEKKWANARTLDGSMWIWIPRYAYKITSGYNNTGTPNIEVKFVSGTSNITLDGSSALPINQGENPGSDKDFVIHPAFKFGNTNLEGIWVMKFEASNKSGIVTSLPNVSSWRAQTPSQMFDYSRKMETSSAYGWNISGEGIDTHMLKDIEWGAVTYLAISDYGKTDEVWLNNSSTFITGCAGSSSSASSYAGCQFAYNTEKGQNASTTGNYYGIYDMSGGAYERTSGYLVGGSNLANYGLSLLTSEFKYVDQYIGASTNSQINYDLNNKSYGNAMHETSSFGTASNSWFSDYSAFVTSNSPFSVRGGKFDGGASSGIFGFYYADGSASVNLSWRTALLVKEGL